MKMLFGTRSSFLRLGLTLLPVCLLALFDCGVSLAQSTAEYAGATSAVSATAASQPNLPNPGGSETSTTPASDPNKPQHIASPSGPPPAVVNRKPLEGGGGE